MPNHIRRFPWCSGDHICLTHRRSPVRSRAETVFIYPKESKKRGAREEKRLSLQSGNNCNNVKLQAYEDKLWKSSFKLTHDICNSSWSSLKKLNIQMSFLELRLFSDRLSTSHFQQQQCSSGVRAPPIAYSIFVNEIVNNVWQGIDEKLHTYHVHFTVIFQYVIFSTM
jgi:hypothetical protein